MIDKHIMYYIFKYMSIYDIIKLYSILTDEYKINKYNKYIDFYNKFVKHVDENNIDNTYKLSSANRYYIHTYINDPYNNKTYTDVLSILFNILEPEIPAFYCEVIICKYYHPYTIDKIYKFYDNDIVMYKHLLSYVVDMYMTIINDNICIIIITCINEINFYINVLYDSSIQKKFNDCYNHNIEEQYNIDNILFFRLDITKIFRLDNINHLLS